MFYLSTHKNRYSVIVNKLDFITHIKKYKIGKESIRKAKTRQIVKKI